MDNTDITIVGGGPVGLALAGWLATHSLTRHLSVTLIDARDELAAQSDPRALALSYGSKILLDSLAWPLKTSAIQQIHISARYRFGRTLIDCAQHNLPALGYVVSYGALVEALHQHLQHLIKQGARLKICHLTEASDYIQNESDVTVELNTNNAENTADSHQTINTKILIKAEGSHFLKETENKSISIPLKNLLPKKLLERDYQQTAIVGVVQTEIFKPNKAWERFTSEGPLALLPYEPSNHATNSIKNCYAMVWCVRSDTALSLLALDEKTFLCRLNKAFGKQLGRFISIESRARFSLNLKSQHSVLNKNVVSVGNAAQSLHPVAGQGLNLGLRDAYVLSRAIGEKGPTANAIKHYAKQRRIDKNLTIRLTDFMARGFTNEFAMMPTLNSFALAALDFVPIMKNAFARQMMYGKR